MFGWSRCFQFSLIVNISLFCVSCTNAMSVSELVRVWHRSAVTSASRVVSFLVSIASVMSVIGVTDCMYLRTVPTSQTKAYRGKDGLSSNTPLRKRATRGCSPNVGLSPNVTTDDNAERAVLLAL